MVDKPALDQRSIETTQRAFGTTSLEDFIETIFGERSMHVPRSFVPDKMFSLAELEALMRLPGFFNHANVLIRRPGDPKPGRAKSLAEVSDRASRGDFVQVVSLEKFLPDTHPVTQLFRALEEVLQAPVEGISAFIAGPGQALPIHHDASEVFTLQIGGQKTWNLYHFAAGDHSTGRGYEEAAPSETVNLVPGDLLYTPKNQIHHVMPGDGLSLSLALVFSPQTWLNMVRALTDVLRADPAFWKSMGPRDLAQGFEARRDKVVQALMSMSAQDFAADVMAQRRQVIKGVGDAHLSKAFQTNDVTIETSMRRRAGPPPLVRERGGYVEVISPYDDPIRGPAAAVHACQYIASAQKPFTPREVSSSLSDESKLALVRKLMRRGIVQPAAPAR